MDVLVGDSAKAQYQKSDDSGAVRSYRAVEEQRVIALVCEDLHDTPYALVACRLDVGLGGGHGSLVILHALAQYAGSSFGEIAGLVVVKTPEVYLRPDAQVVKHDTDSVFLNQDGGTVVDVELGRSVGKALADHAAVHGGPSAQVADIGDSVDVKDPGRIVLDGEMARFGT